MSQRSHHKAKNPIEKKFVKVLNNANFYYDYKNDIDNCTFQPICNEIMEIPYIGKYYSLFDKEVSKFVSLNLIEKEIEKTYKKEMLKIEQNDPDRNGKL